MLETKLYTREEMLSEIGGSDNQSIKRKLERYGVSFETEGRGNNITFNVKAIKSRFAILCITELGFDPRTDFEKVKKFYYHYLNDTEFAASPSERQAARMEKLGTPITRQTVNEYKDYLVKNEWVVDRWHSLNYEEYTTYFVDGENQIKTDWKTYAKAWKEFYNNLYGGMSRAKCYEKMKKDYGGIGKKRYLPKQNGIYGNKIDELNKYIFEDLSKN